MNKSHFILLLRKYLDDTATEEEKEFLKCYYDAYESEPEIASIMSQAEKEAIRLEMNQNIWTSIDAKAESGISTPARYVWLRRLSAAAVLLVALSAGLYFIFDSKQSLQIVSRTEQVKEHRLIRLPDGSTVIVSAGSKLNYPSSFDDLATREVYLEGQAYFDVKHNASKPFIIRTGKVSTTVLGTAFNIEAWPQSKDITVTVARGKVKVEDQNHKLLGIIKPDQQIKYDKEKLDAVQMTVNAVDFLSWKDQDLLLDNVTLAEASELLELRFNVSIQIREEEMKTKRFTTTFLQNESLDKILETICEFNGASYTYKREQGHVILESK